MSTSVGLGALYGAVTGTLTDTVLAVGDVSKALRYTSFNVRVSAGIGLPTKLKELLLEAGASEADIDTPAKVIAMANALLIDIDKML